MTKILIVGLGTIGSRHFESLYNSDLNLTIDCVDKSQFALLNSKKIIKKKNIKKKVEFFPNFKNLKSNYDFLIHSTSADIRLKTLKEIIKKSEIKYAILEKILVQSLDQLKELNILIKQFQKSWVNTPMHELDLYKKLKKQINVESITNIEFNFFEGLACNSIHFIDFVSSWKNILPKVVESSEEGRWYNSKRKGFKDFYGKLTILYPDKTKLILRSLENRYDYHCIIKEKKNWTIIEKEKCFYSSDGYKETGLIEYQSQLTSIIVKKILSNGNCNLPITEWSIKCHEILLKSLLKCWNSYGKNNNDILPIT